MRDEVKAGVLVALAAATVIGGVLLISCGDGPDLVPKPQPAAHVHEPGCGHVPPPDAGPEVGDCFVDPLGGRGGCP